MKKKSQSLRRVYFLISVMGIWGAAIGARLYFLHVVKSADLKREAAKQQQRTLDISPRRGVIYDRNNNELAASIKVDSIYADPDQITDPVRTASVLSSLTGVSKNELIERLNTDKNFIWVKRRINAAEANAVRRARLPGIFFQEEDQRFYPQRELAAHVLGYVNGDEEGIGGLEYKYNDNVRGVPGRVVVMTDGRGHSYQSVEKPSIPGSNLITTLDRNIQYIAEKEVSEGEERTHAAGIAAIMMDPRTGEILAMASYPQFNPNDSGKSPASSRVNRAVSQTYEPGSTFKILTVGAALEEKLTTPTEMIDCQMGSILIGGHVIHDAEKLGVISVSDIVAHSSDVGSVKLGLRLGPDRFYSYIQKMGFGRATDVDLPGEEHGLTKPPSRWSGMSIGAISIGQEIGVTPLQIISMVSSIANGGIRYRPFVVKQVQDPQKRILSETDPHGERVFSAETAEEMRLMLESVVTEGTAKAQRCAASVCGGAALEGYTAAGKTGTAQKIDPATHRYSKTKWVASFAGFAPATNPLFSLIVVVDEPVGVYHGSQVAAPIFKRIAEQTLRYMSVPPDVPLYSPQYTLKDEKQNPPVRPAALPVPAPAESKTAQDGWKVVDASFDATASAPGAYGLGEIAIPSFYGKSLRQVTEECLKLGLRLRSTGSGAAVEQIPPSGANVQAGTHVQVRFAAKR